MGTWCALKVNLKELGKLKTNAVDFSKMVGDLCFGNKSCMLVTRLLLIGDDIDVYNFKDIMWALSCRSRPGLDDFPFEDVRGLPVMPYMTHGLGDPRRGGKSVTNCILPGEYSGTRNWVPVDFESSYPEHVKQKVADLWKTTNIGK